MNRKTAEKAAKLDHETLATYLRAQGWGDSAPYGGHGRLYTRSVDDITTEIVIPTRNDLANHRWLMVEAVMTLARVEDRDESEVVANIVQLAADKREHVKVCAPAEQLAAPQATERRPEHQARSTDNADPAVDEPTTLNNTRRTETAYRGPRFRGVERYYSPDDPWRDSPRRTREMKGGERVKTY